uniref:Uncharacterized protein n=1 Tax=Panstrongylus lignarius TaxID=156445 RepID=A0A224Y500_9HEMI
MLCPNPGSLPLSLILNAAIFMPSTASCRLGLKNLVPLELLPKKLQPPIQPHFPVFSPGHNNHNLRVLSS